MIATSRFQQVIVVSACAVFLVVTSLLPTVARAASVNPLVPLTIGIGIGSLLSGNSLAGPNALVANIQCNPVIVQCECGYVNGRRPCDTYAGPQANKHNCPNICQNRTSGYTTLGTCPQPGYCQATSVTGGVGGPGGAGGALGLTTQLLQLLNALNQPKPGGGAGAVPAVSAMPGGCVSTYVVTQPSADPCAIYQPGGLLGGDTGTQVNSNVSEALLAALGGGGASSGTGGAAGLSSVLTGNSSTTSTVSPFSGTTTGGLQSGLTGDVRLGNSGATVYANLRDGLTEVAGFFGGSTFGGQGAQSALTRVCRARPWAGSGVVAALAPDAFFDGLCKRAGYQLGDAPAQGPSQTNTIISNQTAPTTMQPQTNTVAPQADIWAEPMSVRLGTRTFIFWSTRGVNTCTVNGPSFFHNTVSGAASTVSISGASTFSIECIAPDGTKVTDSVTVNLAI